MVLLDCGEKHLLGDLYFLELAKGLERALDARGLGPVINATRQTLEELVTARGANGVVLATGIERRILAEQIAGRGTPCVVIGQDPPDEVSGVGWVLLDLDSGAKEAARLLRDLGHRRIGFIGNHEVDPVGTAFARELTALGAPLAPNLTIVAGSGRAAGSSAMRSLLNLRERPTAVFVRTDVMALGALASVREFGIRVPEDMTIIGHDDISLAQTMDLTTVRIDCHALGQAAAYVLTTLCHSGHLDAEVPVIGTKVVLRKTHGSPAG